MYQIISTASILIITAAIFFHFIYVRPRLHLPLVPQESSLWAGLRVAIYYVCMVSFLILFGTAFYSSSVIGERLSGTLRYIHICAGIVFAATLAASTFLLSEASRLVKRLGKKRDIGILQKGSLWLVCICSVPAVAASAFSLTGLCPEEMETLLYHAHQYLSLIVGLSAILYFYLAVTARQQ